MLRFVKLTEVIDNGVFKIIERSMVKKITENFRSFLKEPLAFCSFQFSFKTVLKIKTF